MRSGTSPRMANESATRAGRVFRKTATTRHTRTRIFREAAATPEGFLEVDFLAGRASNGESSRELARALKLYAAALPDLCKRHGAEPADFRHLSARFSGPPSLEQFAVTVEDKL